MISTLQFFESQSDQGIIQLVIKPFDVSQTSRIVGLRLKKKKKMPAFSKPPFIFHLFFYIIPHINFDTMIIAVCKYHDQCSLIMIPP